MHQQALYMTHQERMTRLNLLWGNAFNWNQWQGWDWNIHRIADQLVRNFYHLDIAIEVQEGGVVSTGEKG